jgi:Trypsin-like peptidase domain
LRPRENFHPTQLRIRFAWQDHKSIYSYLGVPFTVRGNSGANLWWSSEDGDIATIPMPKTDADLPVEDRLKTYDSVPIRDVISDVYEGESVFVFGYPGLVGNERLVRAIVRQGIVAWTDPIQPDEKVFLVDANLYPGNSGGPVIKFPVGVKKDGTIDYQTGGALKLLGIVSQAPLGEIKTTTVNPRLGKIETSTQITGIGAIGIIEPGSKIRKLIELIQQGKARPPVCDVSDPVQEKSPK